MRGLLFALILICALPAQAAMPGTPDGGQLAFTVMRNGQAIGRILYSFETNGDSQIVRVQTRILYVLMGIPFYRFEHDAVETWSHGRLTDLTSSTNDDGKKLELTVKAEGHDLLVTMNGKADRLEKTNMPASLWNIQTTKADRLIDTVDGKQLEIVASQQDGHFTLSGKLNRTLWYDSKGMLSQARFNARDGSEIRYVRD
ncbi:conserved exported hypothetical protein [Rhodospirillaceae bacterium LM-1]|nr:conserved exported hypothetical protein [Rhodospirillaceae bacterium LM-1]